MDNNSNINNNKMRLQCSVCKGKFPKKTPFLLGIAQIHIRLKEVTLVGRSRHVENFIIHSEI